MLTGALVVVALAFAAAWWRRARAFRRLSDAFDSAAVELEHLQRAFHRFVPPDVVEGIIQRGVQNSGERRPVTVLFADLVGFTALSERTEPEVVVRLLNGYFQAMASAIAEHGGYVAKFMGDGILALFGAPERNPWQARDAVDAALAMRAAMARYNAELAATRRCASRSACTPAPRWSGSSAAPSWSSTRRSATSSTPPPASRR